jgi:predicted DNA-binding ribbon-helix-helix protein
MMKKHSVTISGHATSITLEEPFWRTLKEIATRDKKKLAALIAEIDAQRSPETNLSSAIRLYILNELQAQIEFFNQK